MSGDKELRKAFEETIRRNVTATVEHSNESRKMIRGLEEKVTLLQNTVLSRGTEIDMLKKQLAALQSIIFGGGTSNGN